MKHIQDTALTKCVTTHTWAAHARRRMNPPNKNNLVLTANLRKVGPKWDL